MPASNIDLYHMQDARNNFDAMRPAPVCTDTNQYLAQCQNIHISTNCYYGYHDTKSAENVSVTTDCEMLEISHTNNATSPQMMSRKRSAEECDHLQNKRFREEVQSNPKSIEPETTEIKIEDNNTEDFLETLYWNIHGGNIFHLMQCQ